MYALTVPARGDRLACGEQVVLLGGDRSERELRLERRRSGHRMFAPAVDN